MSADAKDDHDRLRVMVNDSFDILSEECSTRYHRGDEAAGQPSPRPIPTPASPVQAGRSNRSADGQPDIAADRQAISAEHARKVDAEVFLRRIAASLPSAAPETKRITRAGWQALLPRRSAPSPA